MESQGCAFDHEQTKIIGEPSVSFQESPFLRHAQRFDWALSFPFPSLLSLINHTTLLFFRPLDKYVKSGFSLQLTLYTGGHPLDHQPLKDTWRLQRAEQTANDGAQYQRTLGVFNAHNKQQMTSTVSKDTWRLQRAQQTTNDEHSIKGHLASSTRTTNNKWRSTVSKDSWRLQHAEQTTNDGAQYQRTLGVFNTQNKQQMTEQIIKEKQTSQLCRFESSKTDEPRCKQVLLPTFIPIKFTPFLWSSLVRCSVQNGYSVNVTPISNRYKTQ